MTTIALTDEAKIKLKTLIKEGVAITQDIEDLKSSLKDTVKALAEELEIKPKVLNKAIRTAFKGTLNEDKEFQDKVEELLNTAGM